LLLRFSATLVTLLNSCESHCKNRYEGLMPRNDEELRGPSHRSRGHIEDNEHLGMGSSCRSTMCMCCRLLSK
jgi:hypothetical protein